MHLNRSPWALRIEGTQRGGLKNSVRAKTTLRSSALRAQIVLLVADTSSNPCIASERERKSRDSHWLATGFCRTWD